MILIVWWPILEKKTDNKISKRSLRKVFIEKKTNEIVIHFYCALLHPLNFSTDLLEDNRKVFLPISRCKMLLR